MIFLMILQQFLKELKMMQLSPKFTAELQ